MKLNNKFRLTRYFIVLTLFLCGCSTAKKLAVTSKNVGKSLKVMTFNIRNMREDIGEHSWENRRKSCIAMINDVQPDVFGVQEALPEQMDYLDSTLVNYAWVGVGRDSVFSKREYAAVFYRKERFELVASKTFWLSETPDVESKGWDAKYKRVATWAHLKDKQSGKELLVINTHFDHKGNIARLESAKLIVEKIKELVGNKTVTILTGDFNAIPNDELFAPILNYMNSSQIKASITDSLGSTNGYGAEPPGKIIDYIFYRNITSLKYQTRMKSYGISYISDHYPVIVDFKY